jgi:hypothetical protein
MPVAIWNAREMASMMKKVLMNAYFRKIEPMKLVFEGEHEVRHCAEGTYPSKLISATTVYTEATTMTVIFMFFARATAKER